MIEPRSDQGFKEIHEAIQVNAQSIAQRIRQAAQQGGRDPDEVQVIAVTKTQPLNQILPLLELGFRDWGENHVQELCAKHTALAKLTLPQPRWHLIGHLQTNKVKYLGPWIYRIHSVDRLKIAEALSEWGQTLSWTPEVLLQVNITGEQTKSGLSPTQLQAELPAFLRLPNLKVKGLMTMAPRGASEADCRACFAALRGCAAALKTQASRADLLGERHTFSELSMGMSQDYPQAVQEGATWLRLGTALLGPRPPVGLRFCDKLQTKKEEI